MRTLAELGGKIPFDDWRNSIPLHRRPDWSQYDDGRRVVNTMRLTPIERGTLISGLYDWEPIKRDDCSDSVILYPRKTAYQRGYCEENELNYVGTQQYADWCQGYNDLHADKLPRE